MFFRLFRTYWPILILAGLVVILALVNTTPNTFLTGWDTLHPEFDFGLNFKRLFFGVWRGEQGFGTVAGHSHMADLPRVIYLWVLHFFLPLWSLRYMYIFWCLLLGPLGMYFFVREVFSHNSHKQLIAFITSLFYLFNLSTVQQFYVPFEMFPTQYAFLPFILLFTIRFLNHHSKKNLFFFALFNLLATPQAYAAHLWYPFFGTYVLFLFSYVLVHRFHFLYIKLGSLLVVMILLVNAFWLLPNIYFILTTSSVPRLAKQNRLYSQEFRLRNREHGFLKDVALVRGFYFSWEAYDFNTHKNALLMQEWRNHLNNPLVLVLGYTFFCGVLWGLVYSFRRKNKSALSFFPFFVIPFVFLMNNTFPFNIFFEFLLRFSLFEEALRFVFTKFSILLIFAYAFYFAFFIEHLLHAQKTIIRIFYVLLFCMGFILYAFPMFKGELISPKMRIQIPKEYFVWWDFMKTQSDERVLTLPMHQFTGWTFTKWGYQGAGFLWFGLGQPLLDRDFDRWGVANEQAYREISYALYTKESVLFNSLTNKFNIKYILLDNSLFYPQREGKELNNSEETKQFIEDELGLENVWSMGSLVLYKVPNRSNQNSFVINPSRVVNTYRFTAVDEAYRAYGNYIFGESVTNGIRFPYRTFLNDHDLLSNDISIDIFGNNYGTDVYGGKSNTYRVQMPQFTSVEKVVFADIYSYFDLGNKRTKLRFSYYVPSIVLTREEEIDVTHLLKGESLVINGRTFRIPNKGYEQRWIYLDQILLNVEQENIISGVKFMPNIKTTDVWLNKGRNTIGGSFPTRRLTINPNEFVKRGNEQLKSDIRIVPNGSNKIVEFKTLDGIATSVVDLTSLSQDLGYAFMFRSRNVEGLPLRICLLNVQTERCDINDELEKNSRWHNDFFLVSPMKRNGGYQLVVQNISYGGFLSNNELSHLAVIPFPYEFLSKIQVVPEGKQNKKMQVFVTDTAYEKNMKAYIVSDKNVISQFLPFIFGIELADHTLVNNWANGWVLPVNSQQSTNNKQPEIIVIFLPQYLEVIGLGILTGMFGWFAVVGLQQYIRRSPRKHASTSSGEE